MASSEKGRKRVLRDVNKNSESTQHRKRYLKSSVRPTPWRDYRELEMVANRLFSQVDAADQQEGISSMLSLGDALERISIWRARHTQLPHAIETAAGLAHAVWRDCSEGSVGLSTLELRHTYSCAIVRTVNGFADPLQQNRAVATSVALLAETLGIPGWLVDVRHEATHNQLPPLAVLRMAAQTLLRYLQAVYWEPLRQRHRNHVATAHSHLEAYRSKAEPQDNYPETLKDGQATELHDKDDGDAEDVDEDSSPFDSSQHGTFSNSFAALQEPRKRKKKNETPQKKKKRKGRKGPSASTLFRIAQEFVLSEVPPNILFEEAILFLTGSNGVLIYPSSVFPQDDTGIARVQRFYSPFLLEMVKSWPNFAALLIKRLFNAIVDVEAGGDLASSGTETNRVLYFAKAWIAFLLSEKFVSGLKVSNSSEFSGEQGADCLENFITTLPLSSLCEKWRHKYTKEAREHMPTSTYFVDLFQARSEGPKPSVDRPMILEGEVLVEQKQSNDFAQKSPVETQMSLADMEAMLELPVKQKSGKTKETQNVSTGKTTSQKSSWVLCESWNACTIGTLPG